MDRLTGQRKLKGMTSLALALLGSIKVNEFPAKTGLDELPYVHGLETVTFLWYSLRHNRNWVAHSRWQLLLSSDPLPTLPQHWPLASRPRGFCNVTTSSSKKPEALTTFMSQIIDEFNSVVQKVKKFLKIQKKKEKVGESWNFIPWSNRISVI